MMEMQRDIVRAARSTFLRHRNRGADSVRDHASVGALLWDDLMGVVETTKTDRGDAPPVQTRLEVLRAAGTA